jgi:hypothetical protein
MIFSQYPLPILILLLIIVGNIGYIHILYFFTGICLITAAAVLISNKDRDISFLTFLGIFIMIVHPAGSSTGIHTVIIYSFWIVFPISIEYLFSVTGTGIYFKLLGNLSDFSSKLNLSETQLSRIKKTSLGIVIFGCLYYSYFYPYFDHHNRLDMHYPVHNKYMRGIYTSEDRAAALNELLAAGSRYVKPDDYVLAYDCIPLYHYLTDTKSYLRNPWPWLYQPAVFQRELARSRRKIKTLPVVIFQTIRTMGPNGGKWPDYSLNETTLNWNLNKSRNKILLEFLKANHYKEVWANKAFKILVPEASGETANNPIDLNSN